MATQTYTLKGEVRWAKVHKPDERYKKYSIDIKFDEESRKTFDSIGLKNKPREDGFVTLRRDPEGTTWKNGEKAIAGAPLVVDKDGNITKDAIGNGSTCTIRLTVYDYNNSFGKGKGSRLEAVRVDKLVEYKKEEAMVASPQETVKPRIPW